MSSTYRLKRDLIELEGRVAFLERQLRFLSGSLVPFNVELRLPIPVPVDEETNSVGHFILNRQGVDPVPLGKDVVKQSLTVYEEGAPGPIAGPTEVAFDPTTGVQTGPDVEYWAEVGKKIVRELTYTRGDGQTAVQTFEYVQEDNFTSPLSGPASIPDAVQVQEVEDASVRPGDET